MGTCFLQGISIMNNNQKSDHTVGETLKGKPFQLNFYDKMQSNILLNAEQWSLLT